MTITTKDERKLKKSLQRLSDAVLICLHDIDKLMRAPSPFIERGAKVAEVCNAMELENDRLRYSTLGVDFRKDNKEKAVAKIKAGILR